LYMRYRLAGAYDSNVALLLATGADRAESFTRVGEILRRTTLRGIELATNREFLFGMVTWFASRDVWAKPTTRFVVPYLTLVGELAQEAQSINFDYAFQQIARHATTAAAAHGERAIGATRQVIDLKETLLERPIMMLIDAPHLLAAWLSQHRLDCEMKHGRVVWKRNPVELLAETYHLLNLDVQPGEPAAHRIWDHDRQLLETALAFYASLADYVPTGTPWADLDHTLRSLRPAFGFDDMMWAKVRAAHTGHQLGLEILAMLPMIAATVGFYDLALNDDLGVTIPDRLLDPARQEAMRKVLAPPPATRADEIVAAMGGTYYAQEAPHLPPFVTTGAHFNRGDPLYIIEVMKMFNKVYAPFAGTIDEVLVKESGIVVRKGQPLFKVTPDETIVAEDPDAKEHRIRVNTDAYLTKLL
jgi:biotin carboxyl carrier protein